MTGRLIPALRWAGSRDGCCIGCGRHVLEPHTSDCYELADIIRRAKKDNAMPAEFDENTPIARAISVINKHHHAVEGGGTVEYVSTRDMVVAKAPSPLYVTEYGICHACGADITGTPHKCPVNWGPLTADEWLRIDQFYFSRASAVRSTKARQVMGILGPGAAELVATKAKLEAVTAERDALERKNEDYSARLFAANGKIRDLEADLEAESALADALLNGACAAPDHEMQYEDLFGAQSMAAATAGPQKSAAMGRAIGATITGWRPVV